MISIANLHEIHKALETLYSVAGILEKVLNEEDSDILEDILTDIEMIESELEDYISDVTNG